MTTESSTCVSSNQVKFVLHNVHVMSGKAIIVMILNRLVQRPMEYDYDIRIYQEYLSSIGTHETVISAFVSICFCKCSMHQ